MPVGGKVGGLGNLFDIHRPIADSWIMPDNAEIDVPKPVAWRNAGGPVRIVRGGPWERLRKEYEKHNDQGHQHESFSTPGR